MAIQGKLSLIGRNELSEILKVEAEARRMLREGEQKREILLSEARAEARRIKERAVQESRERRQKLLEKKRLQLDKKEKDILARADREAKKLEEQVASRRKDAESLLFTLLDKMIDGGE